MPAMMAMNPALFWLGVWHQAETSWLRLPEPALEVDRISERSET
jgi:hypothetical protein